jgi:hypothetical protein
MSNLVALFSNNTAMAVPSYLAAAGDSATNQLLGGLGEGRNRIGLKGARFRLIQAGQEVAIKDEPYLDVHILGANPYISRTFYSGKYDPTVKAPPACWSSDGIAPGKGVTSPQSAKCATCPQNEKGSKVYDDGKKGRACAFSKRLAVSLLGDTDQIVYQLDVKSQSIFGDGVASKGLYTLSEYSKLLSARGVRAEGVVTRISFDTDSSVPKLYFTPQAFIDEATFVGIDKLSKSQEVKTMLEVTATSVDLSGEVDAAEPFESPKPAAIAAPVAAAPAPVVEKPKAVKKEPAPAPAPVAAEAADEDLEGLLGDLV